MVVDSVVVSVSVSVVVSVVVTAVVGLVVLPRLKVVNMSIKHNLRPFIVFDRTEIACCYAINSRSRISANGEVRLIIDAGCRSQVVVRTVQDF